MFRFRNINIEKSGKVDKGGTNLLDHISSFIHFEGWTWRMNISCVIQNQNYPVKAEVKARWFLESN